MLRQKLTVSGEAPSPPRISSTPKRDFKPVVWRSLGWRPEGRKLNLGSGPDYRDGWDNADLHYSGADISFDIFRFPWPILDETYDSILVDNVLEHFPHRLKDRRGADRDGVILALEELHRVLKPGGTVYIAVPFGFSNNAAWNVVHYRYFVPESLGFLWGLKGLEPTTAETTARFELVRKKVRRYFGHYWLNNQHHIPKYLGVTMDWVGRRWEIVWVLRKPS